MTKRKSRPKQLRSRDSQSRHPHDPQGATATGGSEISGRLFSFQVLLSAVGLVALLLRLINVLQTVDMPTVVRLLGDAKGYFDWSSRIAAGQWYGTETFYQAPLYPYVLAVWIKVFGSGVFGIRMAQAMLGAASVLLLGIAAKTMFKEATGVVAAAMYAVYPPAIYYDGIIQKTSLASFLLCGLLATCAVHAARNRLGLSLLIGVTLGC